MNREFKIPPRTVKDLTTPGDLCKSLLSLINTEFKLTGKTRTDGSNIRKLIAAVLEKESLPPAANSEDYEIVPPKGKGIPKITREFIDTYIVTTGDSYNLQVWNRSPAAEALLIKYESGESLKCTDVRFVFVVIDVKKSRIASIIILTPDYIESRFGKFGKPTIKQQLLISRKVRKEIYESPNKIKLLKDTKRVSYYITHDYIPPKSAMVEEPDLKRLYSIELISKMVGEKLINSKLTSGATKNRGQALERKVIDLLGYDHA
ncbi:MAG: nuclease, partial [Bacteroidetes bacterium]|nr:nuclease [Bacteroidota bacterium]